VYGCISFFKCPYRDYLPTWVPTHVPVDCPSGVAVDTEGLEASSVGRHCVRPTLGLGPTLFAASVNGPEIKISCSPAILAPHN
jgi:hypothetical protein